ncbi:MAG TPA: hypothetical protein VLW47_00020 [Thermodesulfobacteriota bacterium]|jgi:Cu/Ag efflux protein CusF|nr:hypothetical protein [Thermodesulfobacteriota bacterium]
MKKAILTAIILAISVIFVTGVMAAEQQAPVSAAGSTTSKLERFSGKVEKVDEAKKDFFVKSEKEEMAFSWTDTKFTEGKKELSFADLKQGLQVTVRYKKEGDKLVAEKIYTGSPKAKEKM